MISSPPPSFQSIRGLLAIIVTCTFITSQLRIVLQRFALNIIEDINSRRRMIVSLMRHSSKLSYATTTFPYVKLRFRIRVRDFLQQQVALT